MKELYACLNILYLKLFQYEKYLPKNYIRHQFDIINLDLENILNLYDESFALSQMKLMDMFKVSRIDNTFTHQCSELEVQDHLNQDLLTIDFLKKQLGYRH